MARHFKTAPSPDEQDRSVQQQLNVPAQAEEAAQPDQTGRSIGRHGRHVRQDEQASPSAQQAYGQAGSRNQRADGRAMSPTQQAEGHLAPSTQQADGRTAPYNQRADGRAVPPTQQVGEEGAPSTQQTNGQAATPIQRTDEQQRETRQLINQRKRNIRRSRIRLASNILIAIGAVLLLVAGGIYARAQWRYHKQDKVNRKLQQYVTVADPVDEEALEGSEEVPRGPQVDWEGLKAVNDDIVGWLQIPGTVINYPVYQGEDNDFYLHNTAEGDWTVGGQLFMDAEGTPPGMIDGNTLIYGHHLIDGTMFKKIAEMDDQSVFDEVETVWYVTELASYECEPLFLYYTTETDEDVRVFSFDEKRSLRTYLSERLDKAVTKSPYAEQVVSQVHHALGLVTCNYYDGYGRTVLICVPKDEVAEAKAVAEAVADATAEDSADTAAEAPAEAPADTAAEAPADSTADAPAEG